MTAGHGVRGCVAAAVDQVAPDAADWRPGDQPDTIVDTWRETS